MKFVEVNRIISIETMVTYRVKNCREIFNEVHAGTGLNQANPCPSKERVVP